MCVTALGSVRRCTGSDHRLGPVIFIINGQTNYPDMWEFRMDDTRRFQSVHFGHAKVHQNDIRDDLPGQTNGFFPYDASPRTSISASDPSNLHSPSRMNGWSSITITRFLPANLRGPGRAATGFAWVSRLKFHASISFDLSGARSGKRLIPY